MKSNHSDLAAVGECTWQEAPLRTFRNCTLTALGTLVLATGALALDTPTTTVLNQGYGKALLSVTAGPSGAPYGFTVWYMTQAEYDVSGWQYGPTVTQGVATFTGVPTLNTFGGTITSFVLNPDESVLVEIGDLDDETGVWFNHPGELVPGTDYVFCVTANNATMTWYPASGYSANEQTSTKGDQDCVFTQGYWKNHEEAWPVSSLSLGSIAYTDAELLLIFHQPVQGNGIVSLCRQLIATKLNIANGADPDPIQDTVDNADNLIGSLLVPPIGSGSIDPSVTSSLTQALDDFNNGVDGDHCPPTTATAPASWGGVKSLYR